MANIQRNAIAEEFIRRYSELSDTKKNNFARVCNKLLNDNFVYGQKEEDHSDYFEILSSKEIIGFYFNMIDYDLIHNDTYHIFYLQTTADRNRRRLKKLESVIVLVLRLLYHKGSLNVNSGSDIECSCEDLMLEINKTGIYRESPTSGQYFEALKILKKYKLIYFDFREFKEDYRIVIYPTILFIASVDTIDMITEKLKTYCVTRETEDETEED